MRMYIRVCIYASDYPVSVHMKFICAVNVSTSATVRSVSWSIKWLIKDAGQNSCSCGKWVIFFSSLTNRSCIYTPIHLHILFSFSMYHFNTFFFFCPLYIVFHVPFSCVFYCVYLNFFCMSVSCLVFSLSVW